MMNWPHVLSLIANLSILFTGLRVLGMSWEAPQRDSLPLVVTKDDLERHNGALQVRQVLLFFLGAILIAVAVCRLGQ